MNNAETIVQKQLDYYNSADLENFVSTYHDAIEIFRLEDESIILSGKDALRDKYRERFEVQKVHAKLANRIVLGDKVIDHELVSGIVEGEIVKAVAIYKVEKGLIRKVWFLYE